MFRPAIAFAVATASICGTSIADWPQFLGPERDGVARDQKILPAFPGDEPEIVWSRPVGSGFAGPAVADQVVYLFHRRGDRAVLEALSSDKGEPKWTFEYATNYRDDFGFDNGPRAVPLVADGKIYLFGAEGMLHCVEAAKGERVWAKDLRTELDADKGFFGRASSPLLAGGTLVLQVGGAGGSGVVGFDPKTGAMKWKATDHEAGYASPIAAEIDGDEYVLLFTREGLVCLDPADGQVLIEQKRRAAMHASVNAATPVLVSPGQVFLSACYDVGAAVLKLDPGAKMAAPLWDEGGRLDCHYATPVLKDGHLYGFHGRQETGTVMRCIEAATGEIAWTSERIAAGSVTLCGDTLLILTERGELILAEATKAGFKPGARGQILGDGARAFPALADGRLYARDKKRMVCVKLVD